MTSSRSYSGCLATRHGSRSEMTNGVACNSRILDPVETKSIDETSRVMTPVDGSSFEIFSSTRDFARDVDEKSCTRRLLLTPPPTPLALHHVLSKPCASSIYCMYILSNPAVTKCLRNEVNSIDCRKIFNLGAYPRWRDGRTVRRLHRSDRHATSKSRHAFPHPPRVKPDQAE